MWEILENRLLDRSVRKKEQYRVRRVVESSVDVATSFRFLSYLALRYAKD